mgnify:CR=1 FL=1
MDTHHLNGPIARNAGWPGLLTRYSRDITVNISKREQRVLHALAQGGMIRYDRAANGKISTILCVTRDGHILTDCTLDVFKRLKRRRFIRSTGSQPYRVTRLGLTSVRAQLDNR